MKLTTRTMELAQHWLAVDLEIDDGLSIIVDCLPVSTPDWLIAELQLVVETDWVREQLTAIYRNSSEREWDNAIKRLRATEWATSDVIKYDTIKRNVQVHKTILKVLQVLDDRRAA